MTSKSRSLISKCVITAFCGLLVLVYLFPYTWMVMTAFRSPVDSFERPPKFFFQPTLDGVRYLFEVVEFNGYLIGSTIVTLVTVLATIVIAVPAAYAVAHVEKNSKSFLIFILVARMIPGIAIVVPVYLLASQFRLLDTYQVLVLMNIAFNLPFAIWLLRSFFIEVHPGLREAALVDGCSEVQVLTLVMSPLVLGGIMATAVFVFIAVWNEFLFALVLSGPHTATAPIAVLGFRTAFGIQWDSMSAAAFLISAPVIVFAFIMQRYLVQGLTMGSIK
ncbi:ABC transporter permease subunit [Sinorhizobium medicae]|nr:ABC transporter permease subunit [Sinorhizobium medicae]